MTQEQFKALAQWIENRTIAQIELERLHPADRTIARRLIADIERLDREAASVLVDQPEITLEDVL